MSNSGSILKHAIIGGSNKSGTTSLFRYLGDHPQVVMCSKKELGYFFNDCGAKGDVAYRDYREQFPATADQQVFHLEATPNYLDGGRKIAERIKSVLGQPKLIFMLRDPTARLLSYYRSKHGLETSLVANVTFEEFIAEALAQATSDDVESGMRNNFGWQLKKAHYGRFLQEYLEVFSPRDLLVTFFDDLVENPSMVMTQICEFLGIDRKFYSDYSYSIENKSRVHKSAGLRTLASHANAVAEPLLNRVPIMRKLMRRGYNLVNVEQDASLELGHDAIESLRAYYAPFNRQTRSVLAKHLNMEGLPKWLSGSER